MSELPSKLFFRIGEVAGLVGVEPHVLRYWEREFRSIRPTKSAKGQRVYSRKDVENLLRVRDLLYRDGFTIAGAKKKLQRGGVEPVAEGEAPPSSAAFVEAPESGAASTVLGAGASGASRMAPAPDDVRSEQVAVVLDVTAVAAPPAVAAPAAPPAPVVPVHVTEALRALRGEVESFLAELAGPPSASDAATGGGGARLA